MPDKTDYLDDLILHLRLLDVPGDRIGQVLAEAESHLAESGEAPEVAFGPARDYARELTLREGRALPRQVKSKNLVAVVFEGMTGRDWLLLVGSFAITGLGATALFNGVLALFGSTSFLGLPPWLLIVVGAALLGVFLLGLRRLRDPIVDPRSGAQVQFDRHGHRQPADQLDN